MHHSKISVAGFVPILFNIKDFRNTKVKKKKKSSDQISAKKALGLEKGANFNLGVFVA